jgi:hypothetical protein
MKYAIEHITAPIINTSTWIPEMVPADVWWLTGPGVSRPATDIEIYLWKQIERPQVVGVPA